MSVDLKIKVTKDILERSKMCGRNGIYTPDNCAVTLTVKDIFPLAATSYKYIYPSDKHPDSYKRTIVLPLPTCVTNFIIQFDTTDPEGRLNLPEIEFTITIPDEVIEEINIESIRPLLINHPTLELV